MASARHGSFAGVRRLSDTAIVSFVLISFLIKQVWLDSRNESSLRDFSWKQDATVLRLYNSTNSSQSPTASNAFKQDLGRSQQAEVTGNNLHRIKSNTSLALKYVPDAKNSSRNLDELIHSDSKLVPQLTNPRLDSELDTATEDDGTVDEYDSVASSNLSQKKMIKDLTKIVSKGMSGATEQIKLETLENWKKRQHDRKTIKDNRAKLFEDLLTAAIESRKETTDRKSPRKHTKNHERSKSTTHSDSLGLSNYNVDPELSVDAETVLQHLQGLSHVIEGNSAIAESASVNEGNDADENDSSDQIGSENQKTRLNTAASSSSERPFIRHFKKIKKQISERRKQLDHIKKLFNVDLMLNPKDGSLMGKSVNKEKRTKGILNGQDIGEYTEADDEESASEHRHKSQPAKMKELMEYLKENPDILVSVVSELSGDTPKSTAALHPVDETAPSISEPSDHRSNFFERKQYRYREEYPVNDLHNNYRQHIDHTEDLNNNTAFRNLPFIARRSKSSEVAPNDYSYRNYLEPADSAESLLLQTLRERQLRNLARLDMVMARRQQASDRSPVYRPLNSNDDDKQLREKPHLKSNSDNEASKHRTSSNSRQSDEEVLHHFMVMDNQTMDNSFHKHDYEVQSPLRSTGSHRPFNYESQYRGLNNLSLVSGDSNTDKHNENNQSRGSRNSALVRFKEWTDVSQSEASSSSRSDRTNYNPNTSWSPYDLNTGGTSNAVSETRNPLTPLNARKSKPEHVNEIAPKTLTDMSTTVAGENELLKSNADRGAIAHQFKNPANQLIKDNAQALDELSKPYIYSTKTTSQFSTPQEREPDIYKYDVRGPEQGDEMSLKGDFRKRKHEQEGSRFNSGPPVDYFSAYKNTEDPKRIDRNAIKGRVDERPNEFEDEKEDLIGALWAK